MHPRNFPLLTAAVAALFLTGCATAGGTEPNFTVAKESVQPGTSVTRSGTPVALAKGHLEVNKPLPTAALTDGNWQSYHFAADGKVKLVSIVPSIDTKVCEQQTHILGESLALDTRVERVTVSRDLPMAQKRFALESTLTNIQYLSDYRAGSFGQASGLLMEDSGLLARAVVVVDGKGTLRYMQVVPELGQLPDMEKAISVANQIANEAGK